MSTTGTTLDPDGYTLAIDGGTGLPVAINGARLFVDLSPGTHSVSIDGIAANCTLVGSTPRQVTIVEGEQVEVTVQVTCLTPPPPTGGIALTVATTGLTQDLDGYTYTVDGAAALAIGRNAVATISNLAPGVHTLTLDGIAGNCSVAADNPLTVTVTAGTQAPAAFTLVCVANLKNRIVFSSTRGTPGGLDDIELWSINPDGTDPLRITNNSVIDGGATVSPDGSRIAFLRNAFGSPPEIWVSSADGSDAVQVTSSGVAIWSVDWSPTGDRLLFSRRVGVTDVYDLVLIDPDGGNEVVIGPTDPGRTIRRISPTWSPDGQRIAFGTDSSLNTIAINGTDEQVVYPHVVSYVRWAPLGNLLVFNSAEGPDPTNPSMFGTGAFVIQPNGQGLAAVPATTPNTQFNAPAFSPDGLMLAFSRHVVSSGDSNIWTALVNGGDAVERAGLGDLNAGPTWR